MFGPNSISKYTYNMSFSHRTEKFKKVYSKSRELMVKNFNLQDYDILFVPGSGTTGMETVISSLKEKIKVIGHKGKFKDRWLNYSIRNNKHDKKSKLKLFCQLETSTGDTFYKEGGIVDAISSFPYYDIPKNTKCFVTCSNKQLGAFPGLAIIAVRKNSWDIFQEKDYFCTKDIFLYKHLSEINQTPTTCPVQIFEQLNHVLKDFDLSRHRSKINKVCKRFENILETENDLPCPVINILKEKISKKIAKKYELYNHNNDKEIYQVFSYSNTKAKYKQLCEDITNE